MVGVKNEIGVGGFTKSMRAPDLVLGLVLLLIMWKEYGCGLRSFCAVGQRKYT